VDLALRLPRTDKTMRALRLEAPLDPAVLDASPIVLVESARGLACHYDASALGAAYPDLDAVVAILEDTDPRGVHARLMQLALPEDGARLVLECEAAALAGEPPRAAALVLALMQARLHAL